VKTYVFPVELAREDDGRWSALCPALEGCATWGRNREEALRNIREAVEVYVEDLVACGEPLPGGVTVIDSPAVSVAL
jgi:predicted RNase H-like HicB family nuclease